MRKLKKQTMKHWKYPLIAIIFNYILFHSFHWGEYGGAIVVFITIPIVILTSLLFTFIHYILDKKEVNSKYFQIFASLCIVILSYFIFPTENSAISVIGKMRETAKNYGKITINDYFLEGRYNDYEKIVAAKKKFYNEIPDTAFRVNVYRLYEYGDFIENYGIIFHEGKPTSTNKKVIIEELSNGSFKFIEHFGEDSITFIANPKNISSVEGRLDSFMEKGTGFKDPNIKTAVSGMVLKSSSPDTEYFAYKVFYWLLD